MKFKVVTKDEKLGAIGNVKSKTLTGHTYDPITSQPVGGKKMFLLEFKDGDERWYNEKDLKEVTQ